MNPGKDTIIGTDRVGRFVAGFGSHVTGQPRIDTIWIERDTWREDRWRITDQFRYLCADGTWVVWSDFSGLNPPPYAAVPLADAINLCRLHGHWDDDPTPPKEVR